MSRRTPIRGHKLRFLLVGGSAFVLWGAFLELLTRSGVSPYLAQVPTFLGGVVHTWLLNRRLTFGVHARPTLSEFSRYFGASLVGLAVSMAAFTLATALGFFPLAALAAGTCAGLVVNYLGYSRFAFTRRSRSAREDGDEMELPLKQP